MSQWFDGSAATVAPRRSINGLVYYGEEQTEKLLKSIEASVGESDLKWAFDEHEQRLPFDVLEFEELLAG